jgi:hypothetical protein
VFRLAERAGGSGGVACPIVSGTRKPEPAISDPAVHQPAAAQMLSVDARKVVVAGIGGFALTFIVLLPCWSWLGEHHHRVWLWTALAGAVLGLLALPLVRKHTGEGRLG